MLVYCTRSALTKICHGGDKNFWMEGGQALMGGGVPPYWTALPPLPTLIRVINECLINGRFQVISSNIPILRGDISKFFDRESLRDGMNALCNCGIRSKMYRLLYTLNNDTVIRVKTAGRN